MTEKFFFVFCIRGFQSKLGSKLFLKSSPDPGYPDPQSQAGKRSDSVTFGNVPCLAQRHAIIRKLYKVRIISHAAAAAVNGDPVNVKNVLMQLYLK